MDEWPRIFQIENGRLERILDAGGVGVSHSRSVKLSQTWQEIFEIGIGSSPMDIGMCKRSEGGSIVKNAPR
jgi:hypothetical protein